MHLFLTQYLKNKEMSTIKIYEDLSWKKHGIEIKI